MSLRRGAYLLARLVRACVRRVSCTRAAAPRRSSSRPRRIRRCRRRPPTCGWCRRKRRRRRAPLRSISRSLTRPSDLAAGNYDSALTLASRPALATSALADYAAYYKGLAQLRLNRAADARTTFDALRERKPVGLRLGCRCARRGRSRYRPWAITTKRSGDLREADRRQDDGQRTDPRAAGGNCASARRSPEDRRSAAADLLRVSADRRGSRRCRRARTAARHHRPRQGYKLDLGRAAQLYGARRYSDARAAFVAVQAEASGDDRELVDLRIAESDYFLQRSRRGPRRPAVLARSRVRARPKHASST